jgi:hypothetical protein
MHFHTAESNTVRCEAKNCLGCFRPGQHTRSANLELRPAAQISRHGK